MKIRDYKDSDYIEVASWWKTAGEPLPPPEAIPKQTYIMENETGIPWICLSLVGLTHPHVAWIMGLVSNPGIPDVNRAHAVNELWGHVENIAKQQGYENLFCIAPNWALEKRYESLGFKVTKRNVSMMIKELSCH